MKTTLNLDERIMVRLKQEAARHGIKTIYTRDADFRRFAFLEVRDPLETAG